MSSPIAVPSISEIEAAITEIESFLESVSSSLVKTALKNELQSLRRIQSENEAAAHKANEVELKLQESEKENSKEPVDDAPAREKKPIEKFFPVKSFAWDQDGPSGKYVFVYVTMKGVGEIQDKVIVDFTTTSFDLRVYGLGGKNHRLFKESLCHEIKDHMSKFKVKKDRIVISMRKSEGQYGTEYWSDLTAKDKPKSGKSDDPSAGLMDMMKKMYDEGDDTMKKTIGEAMMKSRMGQSPDVPPM